MFKLPVRGMIALAVAWCASFGVARAAADPLPATTQVVAAATAAAPSQLTFSIPTSQDLVVTLTDLQIPSPLASAGIAIAQNGAIAASALLASPAVSATASLPAASGSYTMYVFGVPNAGFSVGTFTACVAPKANPASCIQSASLSGNITSQSTANDPTISTFSATLTVNTTDDFTFHNSDLKFPVMLQTAPTLALFQGSTVIQTSIADGSVIPQLPPGTYQLLAIAQADATVKQGLYDVSVVGTATGPTSVDFTVPVGLMPAASTFINPTAQSVTLKVTDYAFPGALASASALLTRGATVVGSGTAAAGAATLMAPAGTISVWTYGAVGATAGTFSADVSTASADLFTTAQGAGPVGSTYAYAFVAPVTTAGSYLVTAADLQFPAQLSGLSFTVAQNGLILQPASTGTAFTAALTAGPAVLLVSTQTPAAAGTSGTGLIDVNLQSSGASGALVYDKTQIVNTAASLLDTQQLTVTANGSLDAGLTDLKFPTQFDSLALVISQGATVLGKVFGGGVVTFAGAPGTYQLTFVATPSAKQSFGLYEYSVVNTPPAPTVTVTSNVSSATTGSTVQLSWTSTNATSCSAAGGNWSGTKPASSTTPDSVVLAATTTYTLTCTGGGGSTSGSVTVTATTVAPSGKSGGGALGLDLLGVLGLLAVARQHKRRREGKAS
jgi:hypothetical protein